MDVGISPAPPLVTEANTDMARLAGCSQFGQSAPMALIDCNFSNLWSQVGQRYSYKGMLESSLNSSYSQSTAGFIHTAGTKLNVTESNIKRQGRHYS
ncbi:MAG: hypothetical protein CM1200mP22_21450 [Dehalococcoidia bacterium]|nr:MAG: hypothetical protein CM1200mP22_21450 [Dehalococcoidia bacterium]